MLKIGTKVKNIRLVEGDHNIDCKIDGFGPMKLKSEFVKKNCFYSPGACRRGEIYFPVPLCELSDRLPPLLASSLAAAWLNFAIPFYA